LTCFVLIFMVRAGILWSYWRDLDGRAARIARVFDRLPRARKIFPAPFGSLGIRAAKLDQTMKYAVCYAVISRDAYVPTTFAIKGQQPIVERGIDKFHYWAPGAGSPWAGYDYVWTYKPPAELVETLARTAIPIAGADDSTLWFLNSARNQIGE
jgi:hypothetical protein